MKRNKKIKIVVLVMLLILAAVITYFVITKRKEETVSQSVVSAVSGAVTSGYVPNSFPLKKGMYGTDVKRLQSALVSSGVSVGKYGIDGKFGADTLKAVQIFYNDNNKTEVTESQLIMVEKIVNLNKEIDLPVSKYGI